MTKPNFLLGFHCHQPVGNLPQVMDAAYEKAYLPLFSTMFKHPKIKFSAHFSGYLLSWFKKHRPEFIELLANLIKRGQMEILGGAFYHPILALIPDEDKKNQIKAQTDFIKAQFKVVPNGFWLAERVWESSLVPILEEAGAEYTLLDSQHIPNISPYKKFGYSFTEEQGKMLNLFFISKILRQSIPFKPLNHVFKLISQLAEKAQGQAIVFFDDGEKLGLWPKTYEWVYKKGYLEGLLNFLEEHAQTWRCSDYIEEHSSQGKVFPSAVSYAEMMQWSQGGFRNFFAKYPESNHMHKRMLVVSKKIASVKTLNSLERKELFSKAQHSLWAAQNSCALWHGMFGGVYLHYLRAAIFEKLIQAENILDQLNRGNKKYTEVSIIDYDADGHEEVILSSDILSCICKPSLGGALVELDYKPKAVNLFNSLTRVPETYHEKVMIDNFPRVSLKDYCFSDQADGINLLKGQFRDLGNFFKSPYSYYPRKSGPALECVLSCSSRIKNVPVKLTKIITLFPGQSILNFDYEILNLGISDVQFQLGVEFNFSAFEKNKFTTEERSGFKLLSLVDEEKHYSVSLESDKEAVFYKHFVEAVSRSEARLEKTPQGIMVLTVFPIQLPKKTAWSNKLKIKIEA